MYLQTKICILGYGFTWIINQFDKNPLSVESLFLVFIFLVLVDICWKLKNNKETKS